MCEEIENEKWELAQTLLDWKSGSSDGIDQYIGINFFNEFNIDTNRDSTYILEDVTSYVNVQDMRDAVSKSKNI